MRLSKSKTAKATKPVAKKPAKKGKSFSELAIDPSGAGRGMVEQTFVPLLQQLQAVDPRVLVANNQAFITHSRFRPTISTHAKQLGIEYRSLGLTEELMLVFVLPPNMPET